jgi:transcriptional regulator with PAS, ATPase and Fis domain
MQRALEVARKVAPSDVVVLITGESGTGKNLVAQAIHNASKRIALPFVSLNCSAIVDTLVESELFGYEKGAYTGAERQHRGKFEQAGLGTLFLDEIGDLSQPAQAKILRAVEYKQFERVGSEETLTFRARMVAATNRPIRGMIRDGTFREDLYFRLNEVEIHLPPLRERREDILRIAGRFAEEFNRRYDKKTTGFTADVKRFFATHAFPGNVRELRAMVRRGVIIAEGTEVGLDDIILDVGPAADSGDPINGDDAAPMTDGVADLTLASAEKRHVEKVLKALNGNKRQTAMALGVTRPTLDRKIKDYGLGT